MEELFSSCGFICDYREITEEFYKKHFTRPEEMYEFFKSVFDNDKNDSTPRRMMNTVRRHVSLAEDIHKIRPEDDGIKILFLRMCIEALGDISKNKKIKKNFFSTYIVKKDMLYIKENFKLCFVYENILQNGDKNNRTYCIKTYWYNNINISIDEFSDIFSGIRHNVVHSNDLGFIRIFNPDRDWNFIININLDKEIFNKSVGVLEETETQVSNILLRKYSYMFESTLDFDKFIDIFVQGCICLIKDYINKTV